MRDQLAKLVEEPLWGSTARERSYETADAIIAALPDMVQPLVWGARSTDEWDANGIAVRIAQSSVGEYRVRSIPKDGSHQLKTPFGEFLTFDSYVAAKAAAQTDYTRRILSAFGITGET